MTEPLSPAARAVLKAACIHHGLFNEEIIQRRRMIAAVLRAAADQVAPEPLGSKPNTSRVLKAIRWERKTTREQLLAIADELEACCDAL